MRWVILQLLLVIGLQAAPDLILRGGTIYDGTGRTPYKADLVIEKGRIQSIVARATASGKSIDVTGLAVAPGFIDVHTHAENIIYRPKAENFLRMGVTTLVLGNCGSSKLDIGKFYNDLGNNGFSPNISSLIGHGTVRKQVMGGSFRRPPTDAEVKAMQGHRNRFRKHADLGWNILGNRYGVSGRQGQVLGHGADIVSHGVIVLEGVVLETLPAW